MRCRRRRFFRECAFAKDELKREALARRVAGAHAHGKSRAVDALDTTQVPAILTQESYLTRKRRVRPDYVFASLPL